MWSRVCFYWLETKWTTFIHQAPTDVENTCVCVCVSGTTREDELDGRKVIGLEYEAYELMAQSEFTKLCADIRARWPTVTHICVHHRLG